MRWTNATMRGFSSVPQQARLDSAAFAVLAQETRAPVFGLWPCLDASGRHVLRAEPLALEVPETREAGVPHLTRQALDWYAKRVTAEPGGWWWLHRRWKKPQ